MKTKNGLKRVSKFFLTLILVIAIIPATNVMADTANGSIYVNGKDIVWGPDQTIQCGSGTAVYNETEKTLTLNDAELTTADLMGRIINIGPNNSITIILNGANTITASSSGIFSQSDLKIQGTGSLSINSGSFDAIYAVGNLTIDGVNVNATATGSGVITTQNEVIVSNSASININGVGYGLMAENGITIANSTVTSSASETNSNSITALSGFITINDSNVTTTSPYPALFARTDLQINNSTISATSTENWGIWSADTLSITGDSNITVQGATGSLGGKNSATIAPTVGKKIAIKSGSNKDSAVNVADSPFDAEVSIATYGKALYFHSENSIEQPENTTGSGTWDDGGPFTTDECGTVSDRWGNVMYQATGCNPVESGYKVPNTGVK